MMAFAGSLLIALRPHSAPSETQHEKEPKSHDRLIQIKTVTP